MVKCACDTSRRNARPSLRLVARLLMAALRALRSFLRCLCERSPPCLTYSEGTEAFDALTCVNSKLGNQYYNRRMGSAALDEAEQTRGQPASKAYSIFALERRMPRYYFHAKHGQATILDNKGVDLVDEAGAVREAVRRGREIAAREPLQARPSHADMIIVEDQWGKVVLALPIQDAIEDPYSTASPTRVAKTQFGADDTHKRPEVPEPTRVERRLSDRETNVVRLVAEGRANKEIARILNISSKTVETHRAGAMRKLRLSSLADLVRYAVRNGLIKA